MDARRTELAVYVVLAFATGAVGALSFLLRQCLADLGGRYRIVLGGTAVLVMLFAPQGLWGMLTRRVDLQLLPLRRRLILE